MVVDVSGLAAGSASDVPSAVPSAVSVPPGVLAPLSRRDRMSARISACRASVSLYLDITATATMVSTAGDWEGLPRRDELALLGATPSGTTQR